MNVWPERNILSTTKGKIPWLDIFLDFNNGAKHFPLEKNMHQKMDEYEHHMASLSGDTDLTSQESERFFKSQ